MFKNKELSLVYLIIFISSIISIVAILVLGFLWYDTIERSYTKDIENIKTQYIEYKKLNTKNTIDNIIRQINNDRISELENIKEKGFRHFDRVFSEFQRVYDYSNSILSRDGLKIVLKSYLDGASFKDNDISYFIFDYSGQLILNPFNHKLEGSNLLNLKDFNGNQFIRNIIDIAKSSYFGALPQYWPTNWFLLKYNDINRKGYVYVRLFKPLKWVIVGRQEIDYLDNVLKMVWLRRLSFFRYGVNSHGYIFVIRLYNLKGGDCFGRMLTNASNPKIVGKCLSDSFKDAKGFQFRKVFLKDLRQKGDSFVKYDYYVPNSNKIESKVSYFKLYRPFGWIIATGVYMPDLKSAIQIKQNDKLQDLIKVRNMVLIVIVFIVIFFIVSALIFSKLLDKKIDAFFIEFENALRENRLIDDSKYRIKQIKRIAKNFNLAVSRFREYENEFVESFVNIIEARDLYTKGHSQRVALYASRIAKRLGMDEAKQDMIYKAGLLHDIGKVGIPDNILLKPGRLSENEYNIIKYHSVFSYELLKNVSQFKELAACIRHHHEKCDGSGYPDGLKCEEICIESKILAIADIFDALTTTRPYRKAYDAEKAIEILKKESVDQSIVDEVKDVLIDQLKIENQIDNVFMTEDIDRIRSVIFSVDYMTGLLFITNFINKMRLLIKQNKLFLMLRINIKGLSVINYKFSAEAGNMVIGYTAKALLMLSKNIENNKVHLSRAYADVFLVGYSFENETEKNTMLSLLSKDNVVKSIKSMIIEGKNELFDINGVSIMDYIDVDISYAEYPEDGRSIEEIMYKTEKKMKQQKA